jgi:hypothetical protein
MSTQDIGALELDEPSLDKSGRSDISDLELDMSDRGQLSWLWNLMEAG